MFVKWDYRKHHKYPCTVNAAYLVQSVRTERGPRHRHICYLGSITNPDDTLHEKPGPLGEWLKYELRGEAYRHRRFWATALFNLDRAGIAGADREKIIASLQRTVPRPEEDDPLGGSPEQQREEIELRSRRARERNDEAECRRLRRRIEDGT
jgi:hypothetical protein